MGTLLELGNCTLDVLQDLVGRPADQAITPFTSASATYWKTLDVRQAVLTARYNLEAVLIYAATQLAMWLSKPEFDTTAAEMDTEEQVLEIHQRGDMLRERRAHRPSLSLAERLRRGMTGEMGADLHSLLIKSKPIILKSGTLLGNGLVDLTQVLSNFLHERVITAV
jgi:nuclear pore complex protein Nup188